jgi:hypothetical protein
MRHGVEFNINIPLDHHIQVYVDLNELLDISKILEDPAFPGQVFMQIFRLEGGVFFGKP